MEKVEEVDESRQAPTPEANVRAYFVCRGRDLNELGALVSDGLKKGWHLQGGISVSTMVTADSPNGMVEYLQALHTG